MRVCGGAGQARNVCVCDLPRHAYPPTHNHGLLAHINTTHSTVGMVHFALRYSLGDWSACLVLLAQHQVAAPARRVRVRT